MSYTAEALAARQAAFEAEKQQLVANEGRREARDAQRLESAVSSVPNAGSIRQCFVDASSHDQMVHKLFKDQEAAAITAGRSGVSSAELATLVEQCTGCRPTAAEASSMMSDASVVDYDAFLAVLVGVRSGNIKFAELARTLSEFDDLCRNIPDTVR
ncbi:hypothetical protein M885DRAFT_521172 [Pelagophyceae sp. CCMP2097]|nr:hypothetical protein M885DRAFT_521172 [Pelagophyceae sp. CCMP2097]